MKKKKFGWVVLTLFVAGFGLFVLPQTTNAQGVEEFQSSNFYGRVRTSLCNPGDPNAGMITSMTPPTALIFNSVGCGPVTAPDGHQLTRAEFDAVQGSAKANCVRRGTVVNVHFSGLLPGGLYTAWIPINFSGPTTPAATALGSVVGDETFANSFRASASGQGEITRIQPAGIGTLIAGPIPGCLLGDPTMRAEVHLVYHIDDETHGGVPGPGDTWVVQERVLMFLP